MIQRCAPAVVHAHFGPTALQVDRECRLLGTPLVVSFYGYDAGSAPRDPVFRRGYRRLFRTVAAVTAEVPELARRLIELGAPASRVKLLPLSLPEWALREPRRRVAADDATLRLVQIARFVEKKGVDTTLRAVAAARAAGVSLRLTLIGDGPLRPQVDALIRDLGLGDVIERPGFVGYDALPARLAAAHALVQPSRTSRDGDTEGGAPTIVVEAQAQGLAILATNHADIPHVVRDGRTALLVTESDHEALAANIVRLAGDRELLARLSAEARPFALRRHDPEKLVALRERIYFDAIRRVRWRPGLLRTSRKALPENGALPAPGVGA
jgi:colanic acid/amylovoran biosynthesis glycosyltransferase